MYCTRILNFEFTRHKHNFILLVYCGYYGETKNSLEGRTKCGQLIGPSLLIVDLYCKYLFFCTLLKKFLFLNILSQIFIL